jgi:hypothetical protein
VDVCEIYGPELLQYNCSRAVSACVDRGRDQDGRPGRLRQYDLPADRDREPDEKPRGDAQATYSDATSDVVRVHRRPDGLPNFTPPVKLVIDSSFDGRRAAYVCLVVDPPLKPKLIYGTAYHVGFSAVEIWGAKQAIRRVNRSYAGLRPLLVFTDNMGLVATRQTVHVSWRWLSRTERLMWHLDAAANALRRSLD